jgi:hypothetical protein
MINLKEKKLLVKMNAVLGQPSDPLLIEEIATEEARLQEEQNKLDELLKRQSKTIGAAFADLTKDINKLLAEEKKKTKEEEIILERFSNIITEISNVSANSVDDPTPTINEAIAPPKQKTLVDAVVDQVRNTKPSSIFVQPDPPIVERDIQSIQTKLKLLEGWVSKIAMTGPGGGAGSVDQLDHRTQVVVSDSYHVGRHDYYIGVDYPGNVVVYLPTTVANGRVLVVKDESGSAAHYPITVVGRVDNDPDGFIIKVNNGAVQLIYSNGWRII